MKKRHLMGIPKGRVGFKMRRNMVADLRQDGIYPQGSTAPVWDSRQNKSNFPKRQKQPTRAQCMCFRQYA